MSVVVKPASACFQNPTNARLRAELEECERKLPPDCAADTLAKLLEEEIELEKSLERKTMYLNEELSSQLRSVRKMRALENKLMDLKAVSLP
jgi:predicted RNase H-like nuclease (RuvC/YqgF family)